MRHYDVPRLPVGDQTLWDADINAVCVPGRQWLDYYHDEDHRFALTVNGHGDVLGAVLLTAAHYVPLADISDGLLEIMGVDAGGGLLAQLCRQYPELSPQLTFRSYVTVLYFYHQPR